MLAPLVAPDYPAISMFRKIECVASVPQNSFTQPINYFSEADRIVSYAKLFQKLPKDWAGEGSVIPKKNTIENIFFLCSNIKEKYLNLLTKEDVVPSAYGTISLYFEDDKNNELSVEFGVEHIGICGNIGGQIIAIDELKSSDYKTITGYIEKLNVLI
jgi:hypothetical protein